MSNSERRFKKYVSRRVELLTSLSPPHGWQYISTHLNPADIASRPCKPLALSLTRWLDGPEVLWSSSGRNPSINEFQQTNEPLPEEEDQSPEAVVLGTQLELGSEVWLGLIRRLGTWSQLLSVVKRVLNIAKIWLTRSRNKLSNANNENEIFSRTEVDPSVFL